MRGIKTVDCINYFEKGFPSKLFGLENVLPESFESEKQFQFQFQFTLLSMMGNSFRTFIQQIYKIYIKLLSTIKQTKNTTSHKSL